MMKNDNDLISEGNVMVIIKQMNYWMLITGSYKETINDWYLQIDNVECIFLCPRNMISESLFS
jgi:hypothetical protein